MTVYVPTSVASVTMHDNAGLADHAHTPGDRPDLDGADGWAVACSPVCERAIVSGFDGWADGDAKVIQADGRVDVYVDADVTVPDDEAELDPSSEPGTPVFNMNVTVPTPNRQKRPKRSKVTVHSPDVHVAAPAVNVEVPPAPARTTRVLRDKGGTVTGVESTPAEPGRG